MSRNAEMPAQSAGMFFLLPPSSREYPFGGVARRSFGLLRRDLWLPIDPSASGPELVASCGADR
jgi:hypothetical protein